MKIGSSMYLALGYQCNHHCYFCPCGKKRGVFAANKDEIFSALEQGVKQMGVRYITLSGGEPTLHPDFSNILQKCIELGTDVTVLTNGDRLHDIDFAKHCFDGVDSRHVSVVSAIHSINPEIHDRVTGVTNSCVNTIRGMKNLLSLGIPVTIKQCVSAWNYRDLPRFVDHVYREFGPYVSMTICGMDFCGMLEEETKEVAIGYKEMGAYIEKMLDVVEQLREVCHAFPSFSICDLPLCAVDPYYWKYYLQSSRRTIAQYSAPTEKSAQLKSTYDIIGECDTYFEACNNCGAERWCPGVWRSAYEFFGEEEAEPITLISEE